MPRPELSLYKQRKIVQNHHVLLVDVSELPSEEFGMLKNASKATGLIVASNQLDTIRLTIPKLLRCQVEDFWDKEDRFFVRWLKEQSGADIAGIVFDIVFGTNDEMAQIDFVREAIAQVRKRRLESVISIKWVDGLSVSSTMAALAIRHCVESRADYVALAIQSDVSIGSILETAGGGELIVQLSEWDDDHTPLLARQLVAEGGRGVVIPAPILNSEQLIPALRRLSESVFGLHT